MTSNVKRRTLAALDEPTYDIERVPRAQKDLQNSEICRIRNRKIWLKQLPECLMVCNEAERRFDRSGHPRAPGTGGKPLSLEYLADRIDTDDPLYGYTVRTKQEGWLQGFATVTTFTEWQRFFAWDSLADQAHVLRPKRKDNLSTEEYRARQAWHDQRAIDRSGALARELASQVHRGNPEDEGVIWPHLAEVSLLGGLGCGRNLLQTIIDELEHSNNAYTHMVLQAAENAVPFYEKMGFVRVGAVAKYGASTTSVGGCTKHGHVMNDHEWYTVLHDDETPTTVAAQFGVDPFDVVFMNAPEIQGLGMQSALAAGNSESTIQPCSMYDLATTLNFRVRSGTELRVPKKAPTRGCDDCHIVWPDSQAVAEVALVTDSDVAELIRLNRESFPGLRAQTVLPPGSKLRLPREKTTLSQLRGAVAYRHWTFANDTVDKTEESYMMARRLIKDHATCLRGRRGRGSVVLEKKFGTLWRCRNGTAEEMATGDDDGGCCNGAQHSQPQTAIARNIRAAARPKLVDTIVELLPKQSAVWTSDGGRQPPLEREFYYVLTHVEDLDWCHGVRVVSRSNFSKGNHIGKPRWTLCRPEEHLKELDAPAARCLPLKKVVETGRKSKSSGSLLDRVWLLEFSPVAPVPPPPRPLCASTATTPPSPLAASSTNIDVDLSSHCAIGDEAGAHESVDANNSVGYPRSRWVKGEKKRYRDHEVAVVSAEAKRAKSCRHAAGAMMLASRSNLPDNNASNGNGTPPRKPDTGAGCRGQPVLGAGAGAKRGPGGTRSLSALNRLNGVRRAAAPAESAALKRAQPTPAEQRQFQADYLQGDGVTGDVPTCGPLQRSEQSDHRTVGGNKPKRPWLKEEDDMLRELVEKHGPKSWSLIAKELGTRKGKQCRERWINHLDPRVRKGSFSPEEHRLVEEAVATIGHKWIEIAQLLPGRTDNAIKNYWNSLLRHAQRSAKRKALGQKGADASTKRSIPASRLLSATIVSSSVDHSLPLKGVSGESVSQSQVSKAEKEMIRCQQEIDLVQSIRQKPIARQTTVVS